MTCIKFFIGFSGRSTIISDLFSRLHYLQTAYRHFQTALEAQQQKVERRRGRSRGYHQVEEPQRGGAGFGAKALRAHELQNHLNTIRLQMSVGLLVFVCCYCYLLFVSSSKLVSRFVS